MGILQFNKLFVTIIILLSFLITIKCSSAQICSKYDSLLLTRSDYFIEEQAKITIDDLQGKPLKYYYQYENDSINAKKIISKLFKELQLNTNNQFYIISRFLLTKRCKKPICSFFLEGYRKGEREALYEGYEWTECEYYYKSVNRVYFMLLKNGEVKFIKWKFD
jgi:hypothetical protein